jgi:hypothetical protein
MLCTMAKRDQLSIPIDPELRAQVAAAAARENRTVANYVRHLLARAAARSRPSPLQVEREREYA